MATLFSQRPNPTIPLAEQLRPKTLEQFVGQEKLVGDHGPLRHLIEQDQIVSMIFWGPPGSGKTTLAKIIAQHTKAKFIILSAVTSGIKDLKDIAEHARQDREWYGTRTIVFIDEIHRWNKAQQDALLPLIEQGIITLIGATTENPSFEINAALLSRCQVFVFERLSDENVRTLVQRSGVPFTEQVTDFIVRFADGDGRSALNTIELIHKRFAQTQALTLEQVRDILEKVALHYDKAGEEHYNLISALHKTMRASDVNAALYWCGRMLQSGEDPLYVMRRVVEFAAEDIGLADPQALQLCVAAYQSTHFLGMPEGQYAIFEAVAYCAKAPKSRAIINAASAIKHDIKTTPNLPVPMHLRNAPTQLMKQVGYGKNQGQENLPAQLRGRMYLEQ